VHLKGPDTFLSPKIALMMALLFHELATNAAKYGALSSGDGLLSVDWSESEEYLVIKWCESGGPIVSAPKHRGFGTRLLSSALDQFDGKLEMLFNPTGLICAIRVKLTEHTKSQVTETEKLKHSATA
jgi:two-component sensor histidine kinase